MGDIATGGAGLTQQSHSYRLGQQEQGQWVVSASAGIIFGSVLETISFSSG